MKLRRYTPDDIQVREAEDYKPETVVDTIIRGARRNMEAGDPLEIVETGDD